MSSPCNLCPFRTSPARCVDCRLGYDYERMQTEREAAEWHATCQRCTIASDTTCPDCQVRIQLERANRLLGRGTQASLGL